MLDLALQLIFVAPQGHFRRAADMEYGIPGCDDPEIYEAPWGNGWDRVAPARAPGFGVVLGMGQVRTIPR